MTFMKLQKHMKIKQIFMVLFVFSLFISCQEEYIDISEPDKNVAISFSDTLVDLILRVTLNDGSFDNIIDGCSEISIQYPYSVRIRNEVIEINSLEDIERIKQEYQQFINAIIIQFPVTVIFSDYSEAILDNQGELKKIQKQFNKNEKGDAIECLDFIYPVDLSLFNTKYQKSDFIRAGKDKDLHGIFKNINDKIIEIDFPVDVELADGTIININNNQELKNEILNAIGNCDEDDEMEFSGNDQF